MFALGFIIISAMILITPVYAGFFDSFIDSVTGRASSQTTDLSITVSGVNPAVIQLVSPITDTNPTENTLTSITFYVTMYDADGVADLDDTSVSANFTRAGEALREDTSCTLVGDIDAYSANYSCQINMWYWDGSGAWNIGVKGKDIGNASWSFNTSATFNYNQLKAMLISPSSVTWPSATPGASDFSASIGTSINNTGNYDGTIDVTAIDLTGASSESIAANEFVVDLSDGACSGTAMVNATATTVTSSDSNPGNISAGGGGEELYYCIPSFPLVSSQTYTATGGRAWTVAF